MITIIIIKNNILKKSNITHNFNKINNKELVKL